MAHATNTWLKFETYSRIPTSKEAGQLPIVTKIGLLKTVAAHGRERRLELNPFQLSQ